MRAWASSRPSARRPCPLFLSIRGSARGAAHPVCGRTTPGFSMPGRRGFPPFRVAARRASFGSHRAFATPWSRTHEHPARAGSQSRDRWDLPRRGCGHRDVVAAEQTGTSPCLTALRPTVRKPLRPPETTQSTWIASANTKSLDRFERGKPAARKQPASALPSKETVTSKMRLACTDWRPPERKTPDFSGVF